MYFRLSLPIIVPVYQFHYFYRSTNLDMCLFFLSDESNFIFIFNFKTFLTMSSDTRNMSKNKSLQLRCLVKLYINIKISLPKF